MQCDGGEPQAGHAEQRGQEKMQRKLPPSSISIDCSIERSHLCSLPGRAVDDDEENLLRRNLKMAAHAHAGALRPRNAWKIPSSLNFY